MSTDLLFLGKNSARVLLVSVLFSYVFALLVPFLFLCSFSCGPVPLLSANLPFLCTFLYFVTCSSLVANARGFLLLGRGALHIYMQKKLLCETQAHPWASSLADGLELVSFIISFLLASACGSILLKARSCAGFSLKHYATWLVCSSVFFSLKVPVYTSCMFSVPFAFSVNLRSGLVLCFIHWAQTYSRIPVF